MSERETVQDGRDDSNKRQRGTDAGKQEKERQTEGDQEKQRDGCQEGEVSNV